VFFNPLKRSKFVTKKKENASELPSVRIAHLLISILANAELLRRSVLDVVEIDRQEIVNAADNIEGQVNEIAHLTLGADVDEWQAELEKKRERHQL
jgi:hypothetical protein